MQVHLYQVTYQRSWTRLVHRHRHHKQHGAASSWLGGRSVASVHSSLFPPGHSVSRRPMSIHPPPPALEGPLTWTRDAGGAGCSFEVRVGTLVQGCLTRVSRGNRGMDDGRTALSYEEPLARRSHARGLSWGEPSWTGIFPAEEWWPSDTLRLCSLSAFCASYWPLPKSPAGWRRE